MLCFYVSYQKLGWRSPYCLVQNFSKFFLVQLVFFTSNFELSIQARFKKIMILTKFTHKIKSQNKQRIFSSHHLRWKVISHIYPTMHKMWCCKNIVAEWFIRFMILLEGSAIQSYLNILKCYFATVVKVSSNICFGFYKIAIISIACLRYV